MTPERHVARAADVLEAARRYRLLEAERAAAAERRANEALFALAREALGRLELLGAPLELRAVLRSALVAGEYAAVWDAFFGRDGGPESGRLFGQPSELNGVGPERGSALEWLRRAEASHARG